MKRREGENYLSYARRLTKAVGDKSITYNEFGNLLLGTDNVYSSENIRKFYYMFDKFLNKVDGDVSLSDKELIKELEDLKFSIAKERKKRQTVNRDYHANARSEGRFELLLENIEIAVKELKPIKIKPSIYSSKVNDESVGVLFISDAHYGRQCEIKGLFGEVINSYNVKEFETRMWSLLSQFDNDMFDMPVDRIEVVDLGDNIEGILRVGDSLKNLETGVVDSALQYAEFMATWIIELYNRTSIPVNYSLTGGNHDIVRILESKPDFQEETVAKFIYQHINNRVEISKKDTELEALRNNQEYHPIEINIKPYGDILYHNLFGFNLLCYHGDTKNMKTDIDFFENHYQIDIDMLVGGHLHRNSSETVGIGYFGDREVVRVPSICGNDMYSKKIRKGSRAGAKFMIFTPSGKNWEKTYYLN